MARNKDGGDGDYEVGYGKPPKRHRWKKGQSGNPGGAPKKREKEPIDVAGVLNEPVTVSQNGKKKKKPPFEVTFRKLVKDGLENGDLRSLIEVIRIFEEFGVIKPPAIDDGGGVVAAPPGVDFRDWVEKNTELVPLSELEDDDE